MHRLLIRLGGLLVFLALVSQLMLPRYLEGRVSDRLTDRGGAAKVDLDAIPAERLLFGRGNRLAIQASGLSVDLTGRSDVFGRLDKFGEVTIDISASRAGPFTVRSFQLERRGAHDYSMVLQADAAPVDVARYAGEQLAGGFGRALAGLAAGTLANPGRPIPVNARLQIDTSGPTPTAVAAEGDVAGLPAGPLAQIVANTLLGAI
jgi:hypothetical protein